MKDRISLQLRIPTDLKDFLQQEVERNGSTQNSEIIRAIRERMDRLHGVSRHERGEAA